MASFFTFPRVGRVGSSPASDWWTILRIEHTPMPDGVVRCRVFFLGHPRDDTPPKSVPDEDTLGAHWVALDELDRYPLRGQEVRDIFEYVAQGGGPCIR